MKKRRSEVVSEINVTPLVDVMLVLLIIFIISAPLMRSGTKVVLPKAAVRESQPQRSVLVTIDRAGEAFLNGERVALAVLGERVASLVRRAPEQPVLIEGDTQAEYGKIVAVMDLVRQAGIQNVSLVLEPLGK